MLEKRYVSKTTKNGMNFLRFFRLELILKKFLKTKINQEYIVPPEFIQRYFDFIWTL